MAGYLGAADFYGIIPLSILCPFIETRGGPSFAKFAGFSLVLGTVNAAFWVAVGLLIFWPVKLIRKRFQGKTTLKLKKLVAALTVVGFLGAADFYWGQAGYTRISAPLCPFCRWNSSYQGGLPHYVWLAFTKGTVNAGLFVAAGLLVFGVVKLFGKLRSKSSRD